MGIDEIGRKTDGLLIRGDGLFDLSHLEIGSSKPILGQRDKLGTS